MNDFITNAKGLTRNPLGIIALFVSLIYGFACLVLSTSISNLHKDNERLPLIWFIIIFPIVILIAFIFLVVKHHEKLYSPSDYRGDEAFIQTIDKSKLKEKHLNEVKELEKAAVKTELEIIPTIENTMQLSDQKIISLIDEKSNVDENIESKEYTEAELLEIYGNAEKWATQELTIKYNATFKNNVSFSLQNGKIDLDAYGQSESITYIAEIKYWQANKSEKKLKLAIQKFLSQHRKLESMFSRNKGIDFKIIVVLVYDSLKRVDQTDLMAFIENIYSETIVEFFEYGQLKKHYE